jgi:hypothetical protein
VGPAVIPLISIGAKLLAKHQEDEQFKKNLPLQILARSAASNGAPTSALQTQMAINQHDQAGGMAGIAPEIAQLVGAMDSGPPEQNSMYRDPSLTQDAEFENGRLRPDDQLRGSGWARNWKPYGT